MALSDLWAATGRESWLILLSPSLTGPAARPSQGRGRHVTIRTTDLQRPDQKSLLIREFKAVVPWPLLNVSSIR